MALKILKVIWVFSLLGTMASFMYVYAGLPENVVVNENPQTIALSKETFFYIVLGVIAVANALVFVVTRIFSEKESDFKAWFYGLIACTNLFFVIGLSFISLYNSNEKYDFARLGTIIYGSVGLLLVWATSWPVYNVLQKFFRKQPV
ncbi:MAG TPA: hypothetical protein VGQ59_17960 [Cyclobacteriaceae bacterium]|jgi:uncharacterized membrane protein|nr:hypothetical protein [Cyclobacteriaceae bacterium]